MNISDLSVVNFSLEKRYVNAKVRELKTYYTIRPDGQFLLTPTLDEQAHNDFLNEYYQEEEHF